MEQSSVNDTYNKKKKNPPPEKDLSIMLVVFYVSFYVSLW